MLVLCLAVTQTAYGNVGAEPASVPAVELPHLDLEATASVSELYIPGVESPILEQALLDGEQKLALYIEDAHGVVSAQKNIAHTIHRVSKYADLKSPWIALEGTGVGEIDHRSVSMFPDRNVRTLVADFFVHRGEMDGADYYTAHYNTSARHFGIDSAELSQKNQESYRDFQSIRFALDADFAKLQHAVQLLKKKVYQGDLALLSRIETAYEKNPKGLIQYLNRLVEISKKQGMDVSAYPHIQVIFQIREIESSIRSAELKEERHRFLKNYADGQILSKAQFFVAWEKAGEQQAQYPNLAKQMKMKALSDSLQGVNALKEVDGFIAQLWEKLLTYQEAKDIYAIDRKIKFYGKLFAFTLVPNDYEHYRAHKESYQWSELQENIKQYQFLLKPKKIRPTEAEFRLFEIASELALNFYKYAHDRNDPMVQNLKEVMDNNPSAKTFFVAGGFHRDELLQKFREKEIPYVVLTPKVTDFKGQDNYWRLLGGEKPGLPISVITALSKLKASHPMHQPDGVAPAAADLDFATSVVTFIVSAVEGSDVIDDDARQTATLSAYEAAWTAAYPNVPFSTISNATTTYESGWTTVTSSDTGVVESAVYIGPLDAPAPPVSLSGMHNVTTTVIADQDMKVAVYAPNRSETRDVKTSEEFVFESVGSNAVESAQNFLGKFAGELKKLYPNINEKVLGQVLQKSLDIAGGEEVPKFARGFESYFNDREHPRKVQISVGRQAQPVIIAIEAKEGYSVLHLKFDERTLTTIKDGREGSDTPRRSLMAEAFVAMAVRHYVYEPFQAPEAENNETIIDPIGSSGRDKALGLEFLQWFGNNKPYNEPNRDAMKEFAEALIDVSQVVPEARDDFSFFGPLYDWVLGNDEYGATSTGTFGVVQAGPAFEIPQAAGESATEDSEPKPEYEQTAAYESEGSYEASKRWFFSEQKPEAPPDAIRPDHTTRGPYEITVGSPLAPDVWGDRYEVVNLMDTIPEERSEFGVPVQIWKLKDTQYQKRFKNDVDEKFVYARVYSFVGDEENKLIEIKPLVLDKYPVERGMFFARERFGERYVIQNYVGSGAFGQVWKLLDVERQSEFALKIVRPKDFPEGVDVGVVNRYRKMMRGDDDKVSQGDVAKALRQRDATAIALIERELKLADHGIDFEQLQGWNSAVKEWQERLAETQLRNAAEVKVMDQFSHVSIKDVPYMDNYEGLLSRAETEQTADAAGRQTFAGKGEGFIIMRWAPGRDLQSATKGLLAQNHHFGTSDAVEILSRVGTVIKANEDESELNYLHRDIKPENIKVYQKPDGTLSVRLLDWGIAKKKNQLDEDDALDAVDGDHAMIHKSMTGGLNGTPAYMSPEQTFGSRDLDHRTDVYSLGASLYYALTGRSPVAWHVHGDNPPGVMDILHRVRHGAYFNPSRFNPEIKGTALEYIILKMMAPITPIPDEHLDLVKNARVVRKKLEHALTEQEKYAASEHDSTPLIDVKRSELEGDVQLYRQQVAIIDKYKDYVIRVNAHGDHLTRYESVDEFLEDVKALKKFLADTEGDQRRDVELPSAKKAGLFDPELEHPDDPELKGGYNYNIYVLDQGIDEEEGDGSDVEGGAKLLADLTVSGSEAKSIVGTISQFERRSRWTIRSAVENGVVSPETARILFGEEGSAFVPAATYENVESSRKMIRLVVIITIAFFTLGVGLLLYWWLTESGPFAKPEVLTAKVEITPNTNEAIKTDRPDQFKVKINVKITGPQGGIQSSEVNKTIDLKTPLKVGEVREVTVKHKVETGEEAETKVSVYFDPEGVVKWDGFLEDTYALRAGTINDQNAPMERDDDVKTAFGRKEIAYITDVVSKPRDRTHPFNQVRTLRRRTAQPREWSWLFLDRDKYGLQVDEQVSVRVSADVLFAQTPVFKDKDYGAAAFGFYDPDDAKNTILSMRYDQKKFVTFPYPVEIKAGKTTGQDIFDHMLVDPGTGEKNRTEGADFTNLSAPQKGDFEGLKEAHIPLEFYKPYKGEQVNGETFDGKTVLVYGFSNGNRDDANKVEVHRITLTADKRYEFGLFVAGPELTTHIGNVEIEHKKSPEAADAQQKAVDDDIARKQREAVDDAVAPAGDPGQAQAKSASVGPLALVLGAGINTARNQEAGTQFSRRDAWKAFLPPPDEGGSEDEPRSEARLMAVSDAESVVRSSVNQAVFNNQPALIFLPLSSIEKFIGDNFVPMRNTHLVFVGGPEDDVAAAQAQYGSRRDIYSFAIVEWTAPLARINQTLDAQTLRRRAARQLGITPTVLGRSVFIDKAFSNVRSENRSLAEAPAVFMQAPVGEFGRPGVRVAYLTVGARLSKQPGEVTIFGVTFNANGTVSIIAGLIAEFEKNLAKIMRIAVSA